MKLLTFIIFAATLAQGQAASAQRVVPAPIQPAPGEPAPVPLTSHRDVVVSPYMTSKVPINTMFVGSVPGATVISSSSPAITGPQTITTLSPIPATTVRSSGCAPTPTAAASTTPLPVTTYYQPAAVSPATTAPTATNVAYGSPHVVAHPRPYYVGRGLIGQPKLYVGGQPLRNVLRFITP